MLHDGPVDSLQSPRFTGIRARTRLPYVRELAEVDLAYAGSPFDTGVSVRAGARFGPAGTPEVGGFTTFEARHLPRGLAGPRLVAYDLAEALPSYDHGQITALAAATSADELAGLPALRRAGGVA